MAKRLKRNGNDYHSREGKRRRLDKDRLSQLSDELLIRILSFLSPRSVGICERLSRRFHIASDSQIWRSLYYSTFVAPRREALISLGVYKNRRLPGNADTRQAGWAELDGVLKSCQHLSWKSRYKLRYNWSRGSCQHREISFTSTNLDQGAVVRMHKDVVFAADNMHGLRAFAVLKDRLSLLATTKFVLSEDKSVTQNFSPTSMSVCSRQTTSCSRFVTVGSSNGKIFACTFNALKCLWTEPRLYNAISTHSIAFLVYCSPHLITIDDARVLSVYRMPLNQPNEGPASQPRLLATLKSHIDSLPVSLSSRAVRSDIVLTLAYVLPAHMSKWSIGLQEIYFGQHGDNEAPEIRTRFTSTLTSRAMKAKPFTPGPGRSSIYPETDDDWGATSSKPTTVALSFPYLLVSHQNNTLTLYMVNTSENGLSIGPPVRLFGHTSSVSKAQVCSQGKAVTVAKGGDLRVWELEGGASSSAVKRKAAAGTLGVRVRVGAEPALGPRLADLVERRKGDGRGQQGKQLQGTAWLDFNETSVFLLAEHEPSSQTLVAYDFS